MSAVKQLALPAPSAVAVGQRVTVRRAQPWCGRPIDGLSGTVLEVIVPGEGVTLTADEVQELTVMRVELDSGSLVPALVSLDEVEVAL